MLCGLWTPGTRLEGSVERGGSSPIRSVSEPQVKTMQNIQANYFTELNFFWYIWPKTTSTELGLVVHACNPNSRETEPEGLSQVQGQSDLQLVSSRPVWATA